MEPLLSDLHIHTKYSFDSLMEPKRILKRARAVGLERIAITDHGTIKGALEAKKMATNDCGVEVIVGEEIGTTIGDIIGLNLKEEIPSGRDIEWKWVLEQINEQGGISILPHPYRDHRGDIGEVALHVDAIETWNSRCTTKQNILAVGLVYEVTAVPVAGSDAHFYSEIGRAKMDVTINEWGIRTRRSLSPTYATRIMWPNPEDINSKEVAKRTPKVYQAGSHIIKLLKKKGVIS